MLTQAVKNILPVWDTRQQQSSNIIFITFWSQFSVYALNTVLILFLTRPLMKQGLGYSQAKAYAFIGISQATGYLMPILGGFMADQILGIRRAIAMGSVMLACAYLLVMLSGLTLGNMGDSLFIAAYAMIPATNSLLMGTASSMVSHIYSDDAIKAKTAMTYYYMAINVGALLATVLAPSLLDSRYGPLSILAVAFMGKAIAALNFTRRYSLYDNVVRGKDTQPMNRISRYQLLAYLGGIYVFTLLAYSHVYLASLIISIGCALGILWFLIKTLRLSGETRTRQMIALLLIIEAVVFFVIYNQMNSTLILFAQSNSNLKLFSFSVSPAHYQMLNPILIILLGMQLPRFYRQFPRFIIPYQFAASTILAGMALLLMAYSATIAVDGLVNGNFIGLTYVMISLAELWVSAVGLSMIGLYCDARSLSFAMGVWYLASSLSNAISGRLAGFVAIPENMTSAMQSLPVYQHYYFFVGLAAVGTGILMGLAALQIKKRLDKRGIVLA
ncbi:peptide MFS transporter [Legionella sp. CNM-4043-24]|uniref:peptide MFS transporter n=1 Tax=Legionella sp. CNM-4043-24 TaxID=3421646 RepID=UPI00403AC8C2